MLINPTTADFDQRIMLLFSQIIAELDPADFVLADVVEGSEVYTMMSWPAEPTNEFKQLLARGWFEPIPEKPGAHRITVKGLVALDESLDALAQ